MSGEDHNQAVAHAAIGLVSKPDKEKKRGGRSGGGGEEWCWMYTQKPRRKEKGEKRGEKRRGEARWKNRVHLTTSARRCSSHATMPCCCVRSASMSMPMRGNVMCGISCHHHHDELFVCQCVLQPAIPLCVCVCLCVQRARQCRQQAGEHTPPKKKRGERVCARGGKGKQPAK